MKRVLVFGLLGLTAQPAWSIIRRHDVDDTEYRVDATEYPAVVDLLALGDCLGTLIDPEWLLTAAHCAKHLKSDARLTVGATDFGVAGIYLHSEYDGDHHDIAMVQLAGTVTDVSPVPLYTKSDEVGKQVLFVGRGDTGDGQSGQRDAGVDGETRVATNTVESNADGLLRFVFYGPDDEGVTDLEGISGDGDSGGPAFIETSEGLAIAGISAFQDPGRHDLGTYGVEEFYTAVSIHEEWIASVKAGEIDAYTGCSCATSRRQAPIWLGMLATLAVFFRRRARPQA